jgi:hypothetical protein
MWRAWLELSPFSFKLLFVHNFGRL